MIIQMPCMMQHINIYVLFINDYYIYNTNIA